MRRRWAVAEFLIAAALIALASCGEVDPPIKAESDAAGGCWDPQECPAGVGDLSGGASNDLCTDPGTINGARCVVNHSDGMTCWKSAAGLSLFFVSSCQECATLRSCPGYGP